MNALRTARTTRTVRTGCALAAVIAGIVPPMMEAQAVVTGTVFADSSTRPIIGAEVSIAPLGLTTRTDSAGTFMVRNVSAGLHTLTIRALGFTPHSQRVPLHDGQTWEGDFSLRPAAQQLGEVTVRGDVVAGRNPRIAEFEERRKLGFGQFVTQDVFEKAEGRKLGDVLHARVAGVRTERYGGREFVVSSRGLNSLERMPAGDKVDRQVLGTKPRCYVQIVMDDLALYTGYSDEKLFDINSIDASRIAAIEYYTPASRPAQFNRGGNAPCGTLVIWSRW